MKKARWKIGEPLPPILDAYDVALYLGVSAAHAYKLMGSDGFPSIRVGEKLLRVPTDHFLQWVENNTNTVGGKDL